jgi:hypothetical protein
MQLIINRSVAMDKVRPTREMASMPGHTFPERGNAPFQVAYAGDWLLAIDSAAASFRAATA